MAIYARISKADQYNPGKNQSIANQIRLAEEYIRRDSLLCQMDVQVFQDIGYTGTSLDRPGVQKLLAGILLKRIQALVVKDFSRLSRSHIQLSKLREDTFPRCQLIFLSIGDQYDSRQQDGMELSAGFRSIFYEYYCQDISQKVKRALEAKKEDGAYAVAKAPYGYRKGEHGELVICPEEAAVVREIFCLAIAGQNSAQIARELNKGLKTQTSAWQPASVWRILNNPVYTGSHIWHKYESVYRNGFRQLPVDRNQWRNQEGQHPAIIPQEGFLNVWQQRKRTAGYGKKKGKRHIFHGITRCGCCQKALCRHRRDKMLLTCRDNHGGACSPIAWETLWKICAYLWYGEKAPQMADWEKELFLHQCIQQIIVGPGRQLHIKFKTT